MRDLSLKVSPLLESVAELFCVARAGPTLLLLVFPKNLWADWLSSGAIKVSKLRAKKPSVQGCVLSFPPASQPASGVVLTHKVAPAHEVVNIPAGWKLKAKVSVEP
jgi:hypothetical protein